MGEHKDADFSANIAIEDGYNYILETLNSKSKVNELVLYGHSMGGVIALKVAEKFKNNRPDIYSKLRVVNVNSFASLGKVAAHLQYCSVVIVALVFMFRI